MFDVSRERGKQNLLNASVEKNNYEIAKKEWNFLEKIDHIHDSEQFNPILKTSKCELCSTPIRYGYSICNKKNNQYMVVGKDCLTKFTNTTQKEIDKYLSKIAEDKMEELKQLIIRNFNKESEKDMENFYHVFSFFQEQQVLTPGLVLKLFDLFEKYNIDYKPYIDCFKTTIKKNNYKQTLLKMSLRNIKKIFHTLTDTAVEEVKKKYPNEQFE